VESLDVPGALIVADRVLDKESENAIKTTASSHTTTDRRNHMAQDAVQPITDNIQLHRRFAIQTDESVDVSDEAQLLVYILVF
jgi:hypothetical protein